MKNKRAAEILRVLHEAQIETGNLPEALALEVAVSVLNKTPDAPRPSPLTKKQKRDVKYRAVCKAADTARAILLSRSAATRPRASAKFSFGMTLGK